MSKSVFLVLGIACMLSGTAGAQTLGFFELEPNNTCATGTVFSPASGLGGGQLAGATDLDFFRIDVPVLSRLTVTVGPDGSGGNGGSAQAWIVDPQGVDVARRSFISSSASAKELRAIVLPGTHCVRFERVPGIVLMTNEYRLAASIDSSTTAINGLEFEPNDLVSQAHELPTDGAPVAAQLMDRDDIDVFAIETELRTDVEVLIDLEADGDGGRTAQAWLFDAAGNILSWRQIRTGQGAQNLLMARRPVGGRIYLGIAAIQGLMALEGYMSVAATVAGSAGLMEIEPNTLPGLDRPIGPGLLRGQLATDDDIDDFTVSLLPGVPQFVIDTEGGSPDFAALQVEVYSPSGVLLASRDVSTESTPITMNVGVGAEGNHRIVVKRKPGIVVTRKHYAISIPAGATVFRDGFG